MTTITGMFKDQAAINQVMTGLRNIGVELEEVSFVVSQAVHGRDIFIVEDSSDRQRGVLGASMGTTVLGVRTIVFPLFGVVAAGPIVATLASVNAGGLTGGLVGALSAANIGREEALALQDGIMQGKILLAVHVAGGREALVREVLHASGSHFEMAA